MNPPRPRKTVAVRKKDEPKSYCCPVAGVTFEGRQKVLKRHCREGDAVELVREPGNKHSKYAVAVMVRKRAWLFKGWAQAGYIPDEDSREIAKLIDAGWDAVARIKHVVGGGWGKSLGLRLEIELRPPAPAGGTVPT